MGYIDNEKKLEWNRQWQRKRRADPELRKLDNEKHRLYNTSHRERIRELDRERYSRLSPEEKKRRLTKRRENMEKQRQINAEAVRKGQRERAARYKERLKAEGRYEEFLAKTRERRKKHREKLREENPELYAQRKEQHRGRSRAHHANTYVSRPRAPKKTQIRVPKTVRVAVPRPIRAPGGLRRLWGKASRGSMIRIKYPRVSDLDDAYNRGELTYNEIGRVDA